MHPSPPPIERFRLHELIGEGGAGLVVRAEDRLTDRPVAIKFILGGDRSDWQIRALLREMRMVAGLSHPNIIGLIDAGHHVESIVAEDGTVLPPGPWLAMELARGSFLQRQPNSAAELVETTALLLGALAHAHSRGVLHLDVKPTNLLLDEQGSLRLADFGLGLAGEAEAISGATAGWSAPEVLAGQVSLTGPWSDLYSVGRLIEGWLVTLLDGGAPPVAVRSVLDVLLHESPAARFRSVPAARAALLPALDGWVGSLDPDRQRSRITAPLPPSSACTLPITSPVISLLDTHDEDAAYTGEPAADLPLACSPDVMANAPHALDEAGTLPEELAPPGLGLAGLRSGRMVGRRREREALAAGCDDVLAGTTDHHAVRVHGPSGTGLSRLALWAAERVLEHAGGTFLHIGGSGLESVGLADGLRRHFRLRSDGTAEANHQRIDLSLARLGVDSRFARATLVDWLVSSGRPVPSLRTIASALDELFTALLTDGPIILLVDPVEDAFPDAELLTLLGSRLQAPGVLTIFVQPDSGERSGSSSSTAPLSVLRCRPVRIPPMPDGDLARVIRGRIAAGDALIHELVRASAGRPRDAILLLEHLVHQKALLPAPGGYRPVGGLERHLPTSLGHLEIARTLDLVRALDLKDRQALILHALLDAAPVQVRQQALASAGIGEAGAPLLRSGLLTERDGRLRISTMALRRRLLRLDALQDDVAEMVPYAIAAIESSEVPTSTFNPAVREELRAELLHRAGRDREAAEGKLRAAWAWTTLAAPAWALRLIASAERELDDADVTPDDALRSELAAVRAMALHQSGRSGEGLACLRPVGDSPSRRTALARASCLLALGRAEEAVDVAWTLVNTARDDADEERIQGLLLLGRCLIVANQYEAALPVLEEVRALAVSGGDSESEDRSVAFLCHAYAAIDAHERCREVGDAALVDARAGGRLWAIAQLTQPLGDVAFRQGRHDEAIAYYLEGLEVLPYRSPIAAVTWANIARVRIELGQYDAADQAACNALQHLADGGHNRVMQLVLSARLPRLVTRGPSDELVRVLPAMLEFARTSQSTFREVAEQSEIAGSLALKAGHPCSGDLVELASASWEQLGEAERARRIRSGEVPV